MCTCRSRRLTRALCVNQCMYAPLFACACVRMDVPRLFRKYARVRSQSGQQQRSSGSGSCCARLCMHVDALIYSGLVRANAKTSTKLLRYNYILCVFGLLRAQDVRFFACTRTFDDGFPFLSLLPPPPPHCQQLPRYGFVPATLWICICMYIFACSAKLSAI